MSANAVPQPALVHCLPASASPGTLSRLISVHTADADRASSNDQAIFTDTEDCHRSLSWLPSPAPAARQVNTGCERAAAVIASTITEMNSITFAKRKKKKKKIAMVTLSHKSTQHKQKKLSLS